jgi:hypothetical protein
VVRVPCQLSVCVCVCVCVCARARGWVVCGRVISGSSTPTATAGSWPRISFLPLRLGPTAEADDAAADTDADGGGGGSDGEAELRVPLTPYPPRRGGSESPTAEAAGIVSWGFAAADVGGPPAAETAAADTAAAAAEMTAEPTGTRLADPEPPRLPAGGGGCDAPPAQLAEPLGHKNGAAGAEPAGATAVGGGGGGGASDDGDVPNPGPRPVCACPRPGFDGGPGPESVAH